MAQLHASERACTRFRGDIAALFPKQDVHPAGGLCWSRTRHGADGAMTHRGGSRCLLFDLTALEPTIQWRTAARDFCWALSTHMVRDREDKNFLRLYLNGKRLEKLDSLASLGLSPQENFVLYLQHWSRAGFEVEVKTEHGSVWSLTPCRCSLMKCIRW